MPKLNWNQIQRINSGSFTCGHCGRPLASDNGWYATSSGRNGYTAVIYVCHHCGRPTFIDHDGRQSPGVAFGNTVGDVTDKDVADIYDEARRATSASAFTAAVLCCRKALMHIAVAKGAPAGASFVTYVDFLATNHFVPPDAKDWVDHIRTRGNEANHEIVISKKEDAEELLSFVEMLLRVIYEFPAASKRKYGSKAPSATTPAATVKPVSPASTP